MKKIFLTSGIVICMACPAFATGTGFPIGEGSGQYTAGQLNNQTIQNACVEPTLGVYSGAVTLRAKWTAAGQSVAYAVGTPGDNASMVTNMPTSPDSVTFDSSYEVSATVPTVTGYTFQKWVSDYNLSSGVNTDTDYDPSEEITQYKVASPNSATLTAQWTANPHTITYAKGTPANGSTTHVADDISGSVAVANVVYDGTGYTAAANGYDIYGYHFDGWSSNYNTATGANTPTPYAANAALGASGTGKYKADANITMTAQWEADSYDVTYDCGTGDERSGFSVSSLNTTVKYDDDNFKWANNTDSTGCYKNGYHFTGWTCTVAAADTTNNADITIVSNGGVTCGVDANNKPTHACTGNTVAHWTQANLTNGAEIECVAQYDTNSIGITWNTNGGSALSGGGQSCTYNSSIELPANPSRSGYTFAGWEVISATPDSTLEAE